MAPKKTAAKKTTRPRQRVTGSTADQIDNLAVGQSVATAERFQTDAVQDYTDILESLRRQRSNLAAYVARITDELDAREFRVEGGTYLTDDKSAIITSVAVTRVA